MRIRSLKCVACLYFVIVLIFLFTQSNATQFRTAASGKWNVNATWERSTAGSGIWLAAPTYPQNGLNDTAIIRNTHTVTTYNSGFTSASCRTLIVQIGGKILASAPAANFYITIFGDIKCDGIIGNGATFDYLSFNIEGKNCLISGTGFFDASRIRKNTNAPYDTTNLTIAMNINLRFASSSQTQIYNAIASTFNVTINNGSILSLTGSGANTGNACIDGTDGAFSGLAGGTFTIDGTLNISGALYLTTNNITSGRNKWIINNGGIITCSQIVALASGAARDSLVVNSGGLLKITGINTGQTYLYNSISYPANGGFNGYSPIYNVYIFNPGSTVEYAGAGDQDVETSLVYSNLTFSGSGSKKIDSVLTVNNNLSITGAAKLSANTDTVNIGGNLSVYDHTAFAAGTGRVIFNGSNATLQTIASSDYLSFYQLDLNNTANNLQLNTPITVTYQLDLTNGKLLLNNNTLTVTTSANTAISRTNGMIVSESTTNASKIIWQLAATTTTHTFPFGLLNGSYIPFSITKTSGILLYVTASTYGTAANNLPWPVSPVNVTNLLSSTALLPDNRVATVDRFWQINQSGSGTATFDFTYQAAELPASPYNTPTAMVAQFYDGTTNQWLAALPLQSAAAYTVSVPNVTNASFGPWTLSASLSPLPLSWIDFTVRKNGKVAELNWFTSNEINNDFFTIQKSNNGFQFKDVGTLDAKAISSSINSYTFTDLKPFAGTNYYRVKQTDYNGISSFTNTKFVSMDQLVAPIQMHLYNDALYIETKGIDINTATILISDVSGRILYNEKITGSTLQQKIINIDEFSRGLYIVTLITANETISAKIIL